MLHTSEDFPEIGKLKGASWTWRGFLCCLVAFSACDGFCSHRSIYSLLEHVRRGLMACLRGCILVFRLTSLGQRLSPATEAQPQTSWNAKSLLARCAILRLYTFQNPRGPCKRLQHVLMVNVVMERVPAKSLVYPP